MPNWDEEYLFTARAGWDSMAICPRCLTTADHSPDQKDCSDRCITRHLETIRTLTAERDFLRRERDLWMDAEIRLAAQLAALEPALRTLRDKWRSDPGVVSPKQADICADDLDRALLALVPEDQP